MRQRLKTRQRLKREKPEGASEDVVEGAAVDEERAEGAVGEDADGMVAGRRAGEPHAVALIEEEVESTTLVVGGDNSSGSPLDELGRNETLSRSPQD